MTLQFFVKGKRKSNLLFLSLALSLFFCLELFREYFEVTSITILGIQRLLCGGVALFVTKVLLVSLSRRNYGDCKESSSKFCAREPLDCIR